MTPSITTPSAALTRSWWFPLGAAVVAGVFGALILVGWLIDIPVLRSFAPGAIDIKFNTGAAFLLAALSLLLQTAVPLAPMAPIARRLGRVLGGVVAVLGALTLVEWCSGRSLGIDQALIRESGSALYTSAPGRMAPNTAINFMCDGLGLLVLDVGLASWVRPTQWLCFIELTMALLALLVYAYGVEGVYQRLGFTPMALPTALGFITLSAGVLWSRPQVGVIALVTADSSAGMIARRILPAAIILPVVIAYACILSIQHFTWPVGFAFAVFAVVTVVLLAGLVIWSSHIADIHEQQRRRVEQFQELLFTYSLDIQLVAGPDGYFKRVNPATVHILGHSEAELQARPYMEFIHPDDRQPTSGIVTDLAEGRPVLDFENRYRRKDGSWCWLSWKAYPEPGTGMIFAIGRDVTAKKAMEEALVRSNRELKAFAHVASHDLQEPLRMVASYCTMLGESYRGRLDAEADEMIAFAVDGAKRMQILIKDLLEYTRVEHDPEQVTAVSLPEVLGEAADNLQMAITESAATITADALPLVRGHRRQLIQLLQNLLSNAIKYRADAAPVIRISAIRRSEMWEIRVSDNGIGIAPKHQPRLFGMFKRLHRHERYAGNGVGLAICKKIVELHGGSIWIESDLGQGATFAFTLQVADTALAAVSTPSAAPAASTTAATPPSPEKALHG